MPIDDYESMKYSDVKAKNVKEFKDKKLKLHSKGIQIRQLPEYESATFHIDIHDTDGKLILPDVEVFTNAKPLVDELRRIRDNPALAYGNHRIEVQIKEVEGQYDNPALIFADWD